MPVVESSAACAIFTCSIRDCCPPVCWMRKPVDPAGKTRCVLPLPPDCPRAPPNPEIVHGFCTTTRRSIVIVPNGSATTLPRAASTRAVRLSSRAAFSAAPSAKPAHAA